MRRFTQVILILTAMAGFRAHAQVSVTLAHPQPFQVKASEMFNASLMNGTGTTLKVYLVGSITNTATGQQAAEGRSQPFDFAPGALMVSERTLAPSYTYHLPQLASGGYLPYGKFRICLRLLVLSDNEEKGSDCIEAEITPLSPPVLISPENRSEIPTPHPMLVWMPPSPISPGNKVLYDLKLVEIAPNQTPYDAIQRNFAHMAKSGIRATNIQYPVNARPIDTSKTYAWQVTAKTADGILIGETEVWTFHRRVEDSVSKDEAVNTTYVQLKPETDAGYITVKDELKLIYSERYGPAKLTIRIYADDNQLAFDKVYAVNVGDNRLVVDLKEVRKLRNKAFYRLQATAPDRPVQYLMFKNIK